MWYEIIIVALACYLLGNLNGAVSISRLVAKEDVREKGSGNAGLTNFVRNYNAVNGLLVILIDGGKSVLACLLGGIALSPFGYVLEGRILGGLMVTLGHNFPALLGFKGGKGILSALFIGFCVDWRIAVIGLSVFILAYAITKYVSLGSILGAATYGVCFVWLQYDRPWVMGMGLVLSLLAIFMHRGNILRLAKGQESKTNLFKKADSRQ